MSVVATEKDESKARWAHGVSGPHEPCAICYRIALALAEEREKLDRFRQRAFGSGRVEGCSHHTACLIWGDNGRGGTVEGFNEPLPCTCGALLNWEKRQTAAAEARGREAGLKEAAKLVEIPQPPDPVAVQTLAPYMWAVTCWAAKAADAIRALASGKPDTAREKGVK